MAGIKFMKSAIFPQRIERVTEILKYILWV